MGPGYIDTRVGGTGNKPRNQGATYDGMFQHAIDSGAEWVSITSFNEWHEGSQIEPAVPKSISGFTYLDYEGASGRTGVDAQLAYIERTAYWIDRFENRQSFLTGLEAGDTLETWQDSVLYSQNVGGYCCGLTQMQSSVRVERPRQGSRSLLYSGNDVRASISYSYNKVYDVDIPVTSSTKLGYWIYPEQATASVAEGKGSPARGAPEEAKRQTDDRTTRNGQRGRARAVSARASTKPDSCPRLVT